jgi:hypothetical protein
MSNHAVKWKRKCYTICFSTIFSQKSSQQLLFLLK